MQSVGKTSGRAPSTRSGFSRDTFYRYQAAVEAGGVEALIDANRRKPNIKNRVEEATEAAVSAFALEQPALISSFCETSDSMKISIT